MSTHSVRKYVIYFPSLVDGWYIPTFLHTLTPCAPLKKIFDSSIYKRGVSVCLFVYLFVCLFVLGTRVCLCFKGEYEKYYG